jgi:hypothetical protein
MRTPLLCSYLALLLLTTTNCGRRENTTADEVAVPARSERAADSGTAGDPAQQPSGGREGAKTKHDEAVVEDIFTKPVVLWIEIEIPRTGMNVLRRTQWGGGNGDERPTAKATIREGGNVYTDVAVHLKGAAGSFRPVDDHPALTLNFDKFKPGQSFHGLHKISLNNSVQDPSFLSEKICREMFDAAGVPVPRAGHAIVKLNGRQLGLYVLLEGANKQFLKRYFKNAKGNLFDGGFVRDVDTSLSVNSGDDPKDRSGLVRLQAALQQTAMQPAGRARTLAPLEKALDVDRFISMIAMEVLVVHWDGYLMNRNNWRVFHDLDSNRMVFIPHGLDQMFGVGAQGRMGNGRRDLDRPQISGAVAAAVLSVPEGRERYRLRIGQLYTNVFKVNAIMTRVDEIEAVLEPALAQIEPQAARDQAHQAAWFKKRVSGRGDQIARELGTPSTPLKIGSDGIIRLTGWKASPVQTGNPGLAQAKDDQGRNLLRIAIENGNASSSSGSWRMQSILAAGQYRFEGKLRLQDVVVQQGDARSGAGLRVSKAPMPRKLNGTTDWVDFVYAFQVEDDTTEVELICELKALHGEAFFDAGSLRLVRMN